MKFSIALGNHRPDNVSTIRDVSLNIVGGLQEAGHDASLSWDDTFDDAINVYFDYFSKDSVFRFRALRDACIRYALIATEIMSADKINGSGGDTVEARLKATAEIAHHAEFCWVMHEPSLESYKKLSRNPRCYYLPVGYSDSVNELRYHPWTMRDIDFSFFGLLTPYRNDIIEDLRAEGLRVSHIYSIPGFIRNAVVERTRLNLVLRQHSAWQQPSVGRIVYLTSNRCSMVAERTDNGLPYESYTNLYEPEDFVQGCIETYETGDYWLQASEAHEAFKRQPWMREIVSELLESALKDGALRF